MSGPIDLHAHSRVSDGTESPAELVEAAIAAGLDIVALTALPGMEFSTRQEWRSVHVLAYLVDPEDAALLRETTRIRNDRVTRAERIVERIARDYDLSWDDVLEHSAAGATIGRPHIADALVARGHVVDRTEAFGGILHPRSGYSEPHYAPTPLEGVRLIRAAGGVPVLAHPATRGRDGVLPERALAELVDAGLAGLEIEHRENTDDGKQRLRELAERYELFTTGSSDYHGEGKPNRLAENTTPLEVYERIVAAGRGSVPFGG